MIHAGCGLPVESLRDAFRGAAFNGQQRLTQGRMNSMITGGTFAGPAGVTPASPNSNIDCLRAGGSHPRIVSTTRELAMTTFRETKLVLISASLAGYARATADLEALAVAAFLDDWYRQCAQTIRARGGRVVKFMGDGCLAAFPEDDCVGAIETATELQRTIEGVRSKHQLKVEIGANVHLAVVAEGDFGPDDDRRYDVLGSGVNHLFLMGGGPGIRISEPVYRQLPNDRRGAWKKHRPPASYSWSPPR